MKVKKQVLGIVLLVTVLLTACAQQYDSEKDFEFIIIDENWQGDHYASTLKDGTFGDVIIGIYITGYRGNKKEVNIPPRIQRRPVVVIDEGAFKGKELIKVTIPDSVIFISNEAFANNQLTSVVIPNSVTDIWDGAFANNQITNVVLPDSVVCLGGFENNQLTSVVIPNSVIRLGGFQNNQLTSVVIGNSVTFIFRGAFANNQLTSVVIPDSVTEIGIEAEAFANNQITEITIGNHVKFKILGGPCSPFDNNFDDFYFVYGQRAGTYTRIDYDKVGDNTFTFNDGDFNSTTSYKYDDKAGKFVITRELTGPSLADIITWDFTGEKTDFWTVQYRD